MEVPAIPLGLGCKFLPRYPRLETKLTVSLGFLLPHALDRLIPSPRPVQLLRDLLRTPHPPRPVDVDHGGDASPLRRMVGIQRSSHLARGKSVARYMVVLHQRHFQEENPKHPSTGEVTDSELHEVDDAVSWSQVG